MERRKKKTFHVYKKDPKEQHVGLFVKARNNEDPIEIAMAFWDRTGEERPPKDSLEEFKKLVYADEKNW